MLRRGLLPPRRPLAPAAWVACALLALPPALAADGVDLLFTGRSLASGGVYLTPDGDTMIVPTVDGIHWVPLTDEGITRTVRRRFFPNESYRFCDDGRLFIDRRGSVFRTEDGASVISFSGRGTEAAALSPDGSVAAVATSWGTELFSVVDGSDLGVINDQTGACGLDFSSDGRYLLCGDIDTKLRLWDTDDLSLVRTFEGLSDIPMATAISHDGRLVAAWSAADGPRVWDAHMGELLLAVDTPHPEVFDAAIDISRDGQYVAAGSETAAGGVWRIADGKLLFSTTLRPLDMRFDPLDRWVVIVSEIELEIRRLPDGALLRHYPRTTGVIRDLALLQDARRMACAGDYSAAVLWAPGERTALTRVDLLGLGRAVAFSKGGDLMAAGGTGGEAVVLSAHTGELVHRAPPPRSVIADISFVADGSRYLTARASQPGTEALALSAVDGEVLARYRSGLIPITSVAGHPDGILLATGNAHGRIELWSPSETLLGGFNAHSGEIRQLQFLADGWRLLSLGADSTLRVWDVSTQRLLLEIPQAGSMGAAGADGRLAITGSDDGTVRVWNIESGALLHTYRVSDTPDVTLTSLTLSDDARHFAFATQWFGPAAHIARTFLAADLTGDLCVDFADLAALLGEFDCTGDDCAGDLNADGAVDLDDLAVFFRHYGAGCGG